MDFFQKKRELNIKIEYSLSIFIFSHFGETLHPSKKDSVTTSLPTILIMFFQFKPLKILI
jgi:hypothetical protein